MNSTQYHEHDICTDCESAGIMDHQGCRGIQTFSQHVLHSTRSHSYVHRWGGAISLLTILSWVFWNARSQKKTKESCGLRGKDQGLHAYRKEHPGQGSQIFLMFSFVLASPNKIKSYCFLLFRAGAKTKTNQTNKRSCGSHGKDQGLQACRTRAKGSRPAGGRAKGGTPPSLPLCT